MNRGMENVLRSSARGLLRLGMAVVMSAGLLGCGGSSESGTTEAEADAGPIKIGAIFSVSGPASFLGAPEARAAQMFVEQVNKAGGVLGRPIRLIITDSEGSPEKAVSFAKKLIEEDEVLAIIGPSTSGETMQIKNLCEEAGVPLISCAAAEVIVNPIARYVFKTPQKDSQAVTWIFNTLNEMGISRVAVLSSNTGFGQAGKKQLEDMAGNAGIEIVISEVFDRTASDLSDILTKVRGTPAEAVINWSIEPAQAILPRNMRQIGMDIPLFQSHGFGNLQYVEQAGLAAEGILFPGGQLLVIDDLPADHPQKQVLAKFKQDYESRYNEDVSAFAGYAHDALLFVVEGLKKAGRADRDALRDAIEGLQGMVGVSGVFNMSPEDHNGLGLDAFEMLTVKDGRFTLYRPE